MKVAIYSRNSGSEDSAFVRHMVDYMRNLHNEIWIGQNLADQFPELPYFSNSRDLHRIPDLDFLFSLGGDGTLLESAGIVADCNIPVVGINTGRIGFLTGINKNDFEQAYQMLEKGQYDLEERSLLHVETDHSNSLSYNFALNDITVHSYGDISLSTITVWVNGKKVNTYWADGLIIATPTGSTAYSLSCGGPIIMPYSDVNVITPIASHSLSVRPIVVPADHEIKMCIEGRSEQFLLMMDYQRTALPNPATITITREKFTIKTVRFHHVDFFTVIREKLMWGLDKRNEHGNAPS